MANLVPYEYNFEIETIIKQFVSLLNGAVVMRYNINEETGERELDNTIIPQYICTPKQRIIYDLVNKAKNYVLPAVVVSLTGITLDKTRKWANWTNRDRISDDILFSYRAPAPVSLNFEVTIITKYITDLYQIYGKLCTQFHNGIVFSWYVPHKNIDESEYEELTSKVEWSGDISFDLKVEKRESDEDKFTGKMAFKVDGWIFKDMLSCNGNIIHDIGTTNFVPDYIDKAITGLNSDKPLISDVIKDKNYESYDNPREWSNAHPRIVNIFRTHQFHNQFVYFLLDKKRVTALKSLKNNRFTIDGYNLDRADALFIPKDGIKQLKTTRETVGYDYNKSNIFPLRGKNTEKHGMIEGIEMNVIERSPNKLMIDFSDITYRGAFDIAIADAIDYDTFSDHLGMNLQVLGQ